MQKGWGNQKCPYWHSYKIRPNTSSALTLILRLFSLYKNDNIIMVMLLSVCILLTMQQGPDNLLTGTFSRTKPNYYFDNKIIHEPAKDWGAKRRRFLFFSSFDVSSVLKFCTWDTIVCPVFDLSQWGTDRRYFSILSTKVLQVCS